MQKSQPPGCQLTGCQPPWTRHLTFLQQCGMKVQHQFHNRQGDSDRFFLQLWLTQPATALDTGFAPWAFSASSPVTACEQLPGAWPVSRRQVSMQSCPPPTPTPPSPMQEVQRRVGSSFPHSLGSGVLTGHHGSLSSLIVHKRDRALAHRSHSSPKEHTGNWRVPASL